MRLTEYQQQVIRKKTSEVFGSDASVRLFGSRIDDNKKGGDIDLLIELPSKPANLVSLELKFNALLLKALGDQKIDILTIYPQMSLNDVHRQALNTGITL